MTTALLDADIIAFRAAVIGERSIDWGDGEEDKIVSIPRAVDTGLKLARDWTKAAGARQAIVCLSPKEGTTFRKHLMPSYKANRTGEKPEAYFAVLDALEKEFKAVRIEGLEADDVMGLLSTNDRIDTPVVVTIDKDLQGVPGRIFNPTKDKNVRRISPRQADFYWMYQTLVGDPTDGYKGCPGIGKNKALAALQQTTGLLPSMWEEVVRLFEAKKLTEEDALLQARMARILRAGDYDYDNKRIKLWSPRASSAEFLTPPFAAPKARGSSGSTRRGPKAASPKSQST